MNRAGPVEPAEVGAEPEPTALAVRAKALARRSAERLDSTGVGDLWGRLLEMEFIDRSIALAAKLFVSFFPMLVVVAAISPALVREQMLEAMRYPFRHRRSLHETWSGRPLRRPTRRRPPPASSGFC